MRRKLAGLSLGVATCIAASPANAGWIQSFGQSERCIALGGACTAKEGDLGAIYHNPASASDFDGPVLGINLRGIDTTKADLIDSAGRHSVERSNTKGKYVLAPTLAGFLPVGNDVTLGLALGAPFAITADWENDDGIHRFDASDQSLFVLDLTPSVSVKLNDRLSVGAGINIVAFKELRIQALIPQSFGAALPPALGGAGAIIPTTPTSPVIGSITVQSGGGANFGIPPGKLQTSFDEFAFSAGLKYKLSDDATIGLSGRTKTKVTWDGNLTLDLSPAGLGTQVTPFSTTVELPAHIQAGVELGVVPKKLLWSFDVQWTNWADTRSIGTPLVISVTNPLLGFVKDLQVDYNAHNTFTFRTGLEYRVNRQWSLLAGYAYDQSIFDDRHVDILTYDSNRHLLSTGVVYDTRAEGTTRGFILTAGFQATLYESRPLPVGRSQNLGGLSLPNLLDADTLSFSPNRDRFTFGGSILAVGVSLQYMFGNGK